MARFSLIESFRRKHMIRAASIERLLRTACGASVGMMLAAGAGAQSVAVSAQTFGALQWRSIGPAVMGGRLDAVAGVPGQPGIIYLGHSSGGLFKSSDGGVTFVSAFDQGTTQSIGAIAVSPANPDEVYIGTGEGFPRYPASYGDGVYKSEDGAKTWKRVGLEKTERIARIAIDPEDAKIVLVAAMGHEWGPNEERGVFRSTDGGTTWTRTLFVNPTTGASDVEFDPKDPKIVYAGMFDYRRYPWLIRSGGAGSGLYRSEDGGATWTRLNDPKLENGLPDGLVDRVGVAISPSNPAVVYAMLPNKQGLLYRTADGGAHWTMVNADHNLDSRHFYFSQVRVDPKDENRVYVLSGEFQTSEDGGKTFHVINAGGDNHDLWIDPTDPNRLLEGSDMGFYASSDRGRTWDYLNTVPMGQAYRIGYDMDEPYHVMAGFQDHEVWWGPNEIWSDSGVTNGDWKHLVVWGDGNYAMADPNDANTVYLDTHFGDITRVDVRTGEAQFITPYAVSQTGTGVGAFKYRFSWDAPLYLSPHNPNVLYFGGNVLFRTADRGNTWTVVSPDLTTNNAEEEKSSGGPIAPDNSNAESHCTIFAISEDAADPKTLWVGTDDGNVQLTRDGGAHWTNVVHNVAGLPANSWVSSIHASHTVAGRAYVSFDRHQMGDFAPYVYVTDDYGKSWRKISDGLSSYVHVVFEDPRQPNLLYAGTQVGVFASFDRGLTWTDLRLGLPHLPVYDLTVHPRDNDLIMATHGRGIYVLDDVTPLQHLAQAEKAQEMVFKPVTAYRYIPTPSVKRGARPFVAKNKPYGAMVSYYLPESVAEQNASIALEIEDSAGKHVRTLRPTNHAGINRVVWDLREDLPGQEASGNTQGRRRQGGGGRPIRGVKVLPGEYIVKLTVAGQHSQSRFEVKMDPHRTYRREDLVAEQKAGLQLVAMQHEGQQALATINALEKQVAGAQEKLTAASSAGEIGNIQHELHTLSLALINTEPDHPQTVLQQIAFLNHLVVDLYDGAPTRAQIMAIDDNQQQLTKVLSELQHLQKVDVAKLNAQLKTAGLLTVEAGERGAD
jgi:photosystem II stability/assembly factor-like uncharacterized protein